MIERPYRGVVEQRRNRRTRTLISLIDGDQTDEFDTSAGRWQTICEEHGSICSHGSRHLATWFMAYPDEWCERCGDSWASITERTAG